MSYSELWMVLWNWRREFSTREFSSTFAGPDPNKVLHDLTRKGFLERAAWGRYRVSSPDEYLARTIKPAKAYELVKSANMRYAMTGPDAVLLWTKGGYQVDRFLGFYPIHLKVEKEGLERWKKFLRSHRQRFHVEGERVKQTLFGIFYVLYPQAGFTAKEIEGFLVDPLNDVVEFCQRRIYSYEPALEMLDEMYGLGLNVRYREEKTNSHGICRKGERNP